MPSAVTILQAPGFLGSVRQIRSSLHSGLLSIPAAPKKPRKFSKLVLLTASKDSAKVEGAKRKGVHCIMSLGVPGPATLAKALLKIHPEAQRAIEAAPQEPEQKRSKLDTGEAWAQHAGQEQGLLRADIRGTARLGWGWGHGTPGPVSTQGAERDGRASSAHPGPLQNLAPVTTP